MSKLYCINCGQLISPHANFCHICGAAQQGRDAAMYQAQGPKIEHHPPAYYAANPEELKQQLAPDTRSKNSNQHEYITRRKLCPDVKWSFFLSYLGMTWVLPVLFMIGAFYQPIVFGAAIIIYLIAIYLSAMVVYDNFFFSVDETGFKKERGILHKHTVTIPYQQIQNVNIYRSVTDRMLGISRINIETAGSSNPSRRKVAGGSTTKSEGHLPGLRLNEAKRVHDLLLQKANYFGRRNSHAE